MILVVRVSSQGMLALLSSQSLISWWKNIDANLKNADALISKFPVLDTCDKYSQNQWTVGEVRYIEYWAYLRISYSHALQLEKAEPKYFLILWILLLVTYLDCKAKSLHVYVLRWLETHFIFQKVVSLWIIIKISIKSLCVCIHMHAHIHAKYSRFKIKLRALLKLVSVTKKLGQAKRKNRNPQISNYSNTSFFPCKRRTV